MKNGTFKYIYGPVHSWRLGMSLGIDPLARREKICNFNCIYCQLGPTRHYTTERHLFVTPHEMEKEIKKITDLDEIDTITFSGRGEPTLAANLGDLIKIVRKYRKEKIAVITNGAKLLDKDVVEDLKNSDQIIVKLDAASQKIFGGVDKPAPGIDLAQILEGIGRLRDCFSGTLAVQIMFVEQNFCQAEELGARLRELRVDEIEIDTPLRKSKVRPLGERELASLGSCFTGLGRRVVTVYDHFPRREVPRMIGDVVHRHGVPINPKK